MTNPGGNLTRRSLIGAAASLAGTGRIWGDGERLRLVHTKGEKVRCVFGTRPVLEYRYDRARPKTYVHPFFAPNGVPVTLDGPPDHVHHRGIMLAWSGVNGIDFWGEVNPAPHGQIVHQRFERLSEQAPASLTAVNHWIAEGKLLLVERQTIRVPAPGPSQVWMEWESVLRPDKTPVTLDASQHVYNGLGVRFPHAMDGGKVLNANGTTVIEKANGERAAWCTYFGGAESGGDGAGLAIFDHPGNPRHPTPFFVMNRAFGYMSAAPTFHEPFRLKPGESLRLRYRLMAYLGVPDKQDLDRLHRQWSEKAAG